MSARPFLLHRLRDLHVIDADGERAFERDGIVTLADLELAIAEGRPLTAAPAFSAALATLAPDVRPMSLGRAWDTATELMSAIDGRSPDLEQLEVSGSLRRAEPLMGSLTLVGRAADPARTLAALAGAWPADAVLYRGARRIVLLFDGCEADVHIASPDDFGTVLFTTTGPAPHVAAVLGSRQTRPFGAEADLYADADLAWLPPEVRGTPEALARARNNDVPRLVDRWDIKGDLHMHTSYSDGRDPLRHMIRAAAALGYQYIAITDHSEHAGASRTLTLDDLARQHDEIASLRHDVGGMTILHGMEVDILADGSLDCPDDVLAGLDIVLASLHEGLGHDGRRLTKRCLAAIRHPLVSAITHPSNQLVGRRAGYDMDYDAIYAAAVETGTALEVDGAPSHLDLSGERAAEAVRAGVTLIVDSDCHRAPALERQMQMGVGTARRGWVEARHVLNTRPLSEVRAFLGRKRAG